MCVCASNEKKVFFRFFISLFLPLKVSAVTPLLCSRQSEILCFPCQRDLLLCYFLKAATFLTPSLPDTLFLSDCLSFPALLFCISPITGSVRRLSEVSPCLYQSPSPCWFFNCSHLLVKNKKKRISHFDCLRIPRLNGKKISPHFHDHEKGIASKRTFRVMFVFPLSHFGSGRRNRFRPLPLLRFPEQTGVALADESYDSQSNAGAFSVLWTYSSPERCIQVDVIFSPSTLSPSSCALLCPPFRIQPPPSRQEMQVFSPT
jgi:hypothetical protein